MPAAMRALEMEPVAAKMEFMTPHSTRKFSALQQVFHEWPSICSLRSGN